jgi:hypothetical protein
MIFARASTWRGRIAVICFIFCVSLGSRAAEETHAANVAAAPITEGLRVFTCGHSFHVWVAPIVADIAEKAGITGHQIAGLSSIGGSRVIQHWELPDERNKAKQALIAGQVDVLTLSPIWLPDDGIEKFARLALEHNPNMRVTVQEFWLPNDTYHPVYPLESNLRIDHNGTKIPELRHQNDLYRHDIEAFVRDLNTRLGKQVVFVVPVGEASVNLRQRIVTSRDARPVEEQWGLFWDSWGHPTAPLKVLAAYCHFAVIYRRSPVGLPMPKELVENRDYAVPKLNRLLQELAWDAVIHNPLSGVRASDAPLLQP